MKVIFANVINRFGAGSELLSVFGIAATAGMAIGTVIFPYLMEKFRPGQIVITYGITLGIFLYKYGIE